MQTKILPADDLNALRHAVDVLRNGGLVAFPTDTVYGLAAPPAMEESVERLYIVKGRSHTKAIAVLMGSAEELEVVSLNPGPMATRLAAAFWPGPITLIVTRNPDLPDIVSPLPTVGVRVPDHPHALGLLGLTGPLAVTSANVSGGESPTSAKEVLRQLGGRIHLILDGGRTPGGIPSTVVDCTGSTPAVLRPGPISLTQIEKVLK